MDMQTSFLQGFRLLDGGEVLALKTQLASGTTGIAANPVGTQLSAVPLTAYVNEITAGVLNASVMLPAAVPGLSIVVINDGPNTIQVFTNPYNPQTGMADTIVAAGAVTTSNVATVASGAVARFYAISYGRWKAA